MASALSRALDALTDPGRREVLENLAAGPRSVAELSTRLAAPGPVLDQWLGTLREAGLVAEVPGSASASYQIDLHGVEELRDYLERLANLPSAEISGVPVERPQPEDVVRGTVGVHQVQEQAFQLFTTGMGSWWPLGRCHLGRTPAVTVVLEPRVGGRWYERGDDGSITPWGEVMIWEEPERIVLTWRLSADWSYSPWVRTEVEVRFIPEGPFGCRVEVEHGDLAQVGAEANRLQGVLGGSEGWSAILRRFADAA
ncbi:MAG: SRPBCC domain-containing protein [Candidatus Dormibacteria bacterium]